MSPMGVALAVIAGVAVVAWLMRGKGDETMGEGTAAPRPAREEPSGSYGDDEPDEGELIEAVAVTSDGWAFVPVRTGVELVPPGEDEDVLRATAEERGSDVLHQATDRAPINPHTGKRLVQWKPGEPLAAGDLIAARVVRGAPGVDPWRLEALGRDYDYRTFAFEIEEGARTALALVEERIVRPPRDEHGDPIPVGAEDFAVARRKSEETEEALAMEGDDEPEDDARRRER